MSERLLEISTRYICAGCEYRWTRRFWVPVKVATEFGPEIHIQVPASVSPCCGS